MLGRSKSRERRDSSADKAGEVGRASLMPVTAVTPVIAAHGGAGATTLCRWLGYYAQDWGMSIPPEFDGGSLVVVAKGNAHGTARATELVRYLVSLPDCGPIVLAVVGDGLGSQPLAARARLRALSPHVAAVVSIPYVGRWRYEDDPLSRPAPPPYMQALTQLRAAVEPSTTATMPTRRQTWAPSPSS